MEQVAAVGRDKGVVVRQPAEDGPERRQEPRPGVEPAFEQFLSVLVGQLPQLLADRGDGVVLLVDRERLARDQLPFLGAEEEHQPHHDRQGRLVEDFLPDPRQQLPAEVLVGPVERVDQDLHRPPHLIAKLISDLLLVGGTLFQQSFEGLILRYAEKSLNRQQAPERPERDRLIEPEVRMPRGVPRGLSDRGVHQHPVLAVRHQPQPHARTVEQLSHPSIR